LALLQATTKVGDGLGVAIGAVEALARSGRAYAREAGFGRIDEHQVGDVEHGEGVVDQLRRWLGRR
jgi:hypothetical protein